MSSFAYKKIDLYIHDWNHFIYSELAGKHEFDLEACRSLVCMMDVSLVLCVTTLDSPQITNMFHRLMYGRAHRMRAHQDVTF
jgi:hypothetical protein